MTPEEKQARAIAVRALFEDDTLKAALKEIEAELVAEWKRAYDTQERENLWRAMHIMDRLKAWMLSAASYDLTALKRTGK